MARQPPERTPSGRNEVGAFGPLSRGGYAGQFTPGDIADPFGKEWVPDYYAPWTGVPGALVWYLQVGLIAWGHIVAVFEAHGVSLRLHERAGAALLAQTPLVLLMVGYTFVGLWTLGQLLQAP